MDGAGEATPRGGHGRGSREEAIASWRRRGAPAPARRRGPRAAAVGVAVALAAGGALAWGLSGRSPAVEPDPFTARGILAEPSNEGLVRPLSAVPGELVAVAGHHVMVWASGGIAEVYDATDGQREWTNERVLPDQVPVTSDGAAFLVRTGGQLQALDAATGRLRWTRDLVVNHGYTVTPAGIFVPHAPGPELPTDAVDVLDPATGATLRTFSPPCNAPSLLHLAVPVFDCGGGRTYVLGPTGDRPTWQGVREPGTYVDELGAGLVAVQPLGERRQAVDAATGRSRFEIPEGTRPLGAADPTSVLLLRADGSVERRDVGDGRVLGSVTLADPTGADVGNAASGPHWVVAGSTLVAVPSSGLEVGGPAAGRWRVGAVAWDVRTGAQVERSLTGPTVDFPGFSFGDRAKLGAGVLAVGGVLALGPHRARVPHVVLFGLTLG